MKDVFEFGAFRLDAEDGSLRRGEELLRLPRKAADVLLLLVEEPGVVRSRDELLSQVWDATVSPASLDYQVFLIRRALGKDADGKEFVETIPRRGFRFAGTVQRIHRRKVQTTGDEPQPVAPVAEKPEPPSPVAALVIARTQRRRTPVLLAALVVSSTVLASAAAVGLSRPESFRIVESRALRLSRPPEGALPLLTDGAKIYYQAAAGDGRRAVAMTGGETVDVFDRASRLWVADPGGPNTGRLAIRGDGASEGELWVVPLGAGAARRVGDLTAIEAQWSPDGQRIALVSQGRIFIADGDGKDVVSTPTPPRSTSSYNPRWSPDGSVVRFTASVPRHAVQQDTALWEVRPDGTGLRPVLQKWDGTVNTCCGVWSPDGRHFVFQATRRDRRSDLWVLTEPTRVDGWLRRRQRLTPLTAGPLSLSAPVMSPDGRTLLAVGSLTQGELVRWDSAVRAFVPYLTWLSGTWVAFSPDRQWVAYVGYPDRSLWRARVDGTERQALVTGDFELDGVGWSPNGRWISFRSRMAGLRMKTFLIPSSGGTPVPISDDDREQGIASWSADSAQLVFGDVPAVFGVPDGGEVLHVYDVARKTSSSVPGSEGLWTARWSPDGRFIAALTIDKQHKQRMKLFDTATQRWRTLDAVHVDNPSWSHDSTFVYYNTEGSASQLLRVRVADGRIEHLATMEFPLAVYGWSGLTPDDAPMVLRNLSTPTVYALTLEGGR